MFNGVECYLWRTLIHPFNQARLGLLGFTENFLFEFYGGKLPSTLNVWIKESDIVIVEAGLGILFISQIKKINPLCKIAYFASDDLATLSASKYLEERLKRDLQYVDLVRLPSAHLMRHFSNAKKVCLIYHGMDHGILSIDEPSPYGPGIHAVSVGSMLFDTNFFDIAIEQFPDINFHVIGSGIERKTLPKNVIYYEEMNFRETIRFVKYANLGIAPYRAMPNAEYLADTSLKLQQLAFFGVPAVCPYFAVGCMEGYRFGYVPGDPFTIGNAIRSALSCQRPTPKKYPSWREATEKLFSELQSIDLIE
jgi:2-beta-glucuronyltransferase